MTTPLSTSRRTTSAGTRRGSRVDAVHLRYAVGRRDVLPDVTLTVRPGQLVALMGPSGAGKTTLLQLLAGVLPATGGEVLHDGTPVGTADGSSVGFVPQDDIVHVDLPLRRTLQYAADMLPVRSGAARVDDVLRSLGLGARADVPVRRLSGGQRKRASIAVELLADPGTLFLDEPTSGLDPATGVDVVGVLRGLADAGTTVVLTTHAPDDAAACDVVVLLDARGQVAYAGPPDAAAARFGVDRLAQVFALLGGPGTVPGGPPGAPPAGPAVPAPRSESTSPLPRPSPAPRPGVLRQSLVLTRRNLETLVRSPLTLAVLVGSPVLVTLMLAVLFEPGAATAGAADALSPLAFWCAFSGFFFGLTYGLLQVVPELAVVRREHRAGLRPPAYVLAKMLALLPVLAVVTGFLLGVLRVLDRLPAAEPGVYASLFTTLYVEEAAALALGLLASAAVSTASQAALALPMLCFPQVLFAGGVLPVDDMALPGRWMSRVLANRYGFEAVASTLAGQQPGGSAGTGGTTGPWLALAVLTGCAAALTVAVVALKVSPPRPRGSARSRAAGRPA